LRVAASGGICDEGLKDAACGQLPPGFCSRWMVPLKLADGAVMGEWVAFAREDGEPDPDTIELASVYGSVIALGLKGLSEQSSLAARYQAVVVALTSALDARDEYTGHHSTEASGLAVQVARRMHLSEDQVDLVAQVAMLHDIGKLGVPTHILLKPGPLDQAELALMREHPVIGERILSGIPGLGEVAAAIRHEHERWDAGGYPDGLAGEQIPLASRIVFACDAWHAMISDRPYRPAMPAAKALDELREGAGSQFDPRVAQALLEILGDNAPPPACSPSESRDRALSRELSPLAADIGAEDLFVFRKVSGGVYSHLGGVGRGAGWAGNIELDSSQESHLHAAIASRQPKLIALERTGRIVGPYYARSALIVPCDDDCLVVFGSSTASMATADTDAAVKAADRARALVLDVSPAKRLADELEVMSAVREIMAVPGESMEETLEAIAARARNALSAEYAAVATIASEDVDLAVGVSAGAWSPSDPDAVTRALGAFAARLPELPLLCQDVAELPDAPEGFRSEDGVSSLHVLPIGSPAAAVIVVVHAVPGLRGFTALCQRVAQAMSDAADLVVRRAIAQQRLRSENAALAQRIGTDTLTGVASRAAWEEALFAEELHRGRSGSPVSVAIIDIDDLKVVNDEIGHAAGDELLRCCAGLLAGSVRATDVVARIGGDEFGVLLRYTDAEQAQTWCERLEAHLGSACSMDLRLSYGVSSVPPRESVADAVHDADRRMYEMKRLSRRGSRRPAEA
jgi:diguanylate cyclase (GGDEF)-like protein